MYCVVSWDISAVNPRWSAIDEKLRDCLTAYTWFRPVNTFYAIWVSTPNQVSSIRESLVAVVNSVGETVHFVISPALPPGSWDGWLPKDHWPKLSNITG